MNSLDSPEQLPTEPQPRLLAEHFFRHQSGRLVSTLTRVLGVQHLDLVEDVVQAAFVQALRSWSVRGIPRDPAAWLFQVARNSAFDTLRRDRIRSEQMQLHAAREHEPENRLFDAVDREDEIADDQLRMLFLCCHPVLPRESQLAFALKMLGGFSVPEIARGLLTSEANAQKRITRAKERLRSEPVLEVDGTAVQERLESALSVVYLIFNEGYNALSAERVVRVDLCQEALRLGGLLADREVCRTPETCALMALMSLHAVRFASRESVDGEILLLEEQDRSAWDGDLLRQGLAWMGESARGDSLSIYHLEAGIAAEHCRATSFSETNWPRILHLYDLLVTVQPSAIHRLNRGIAVAYVHGPQAGLNALAQVDPNDIPPNYYLWDSTLGELHRRAGNRDDARHHFQIALGATKSRAEQELLRTRLQNAD